MNIRLVPLCECGHGRAYHFDDGPCFQCVTGPYRCPLYVAAKVLVVAA